MSDQLKEVCRGCGLHRNLRRHFWWKPKCKKAYEEAEVLPAVEDSMQVEELSPDVLLAASECLPVDIDSVVEKKETVMRSLSALNRWTTEAHIGEKWKTDIKDSITQNINRALDGVEEALKERDYSTDEIMALVRDRLQLFDGLRTPRQEETTLKATMPHLQSFPRKVGPRDDDIAQMTIVADWLQLKMNSNKR